MSSFSTRPDSDVQVVTFESAGGLNDFRNSVLRDALYELVANHSDPRMQQAPVTMTVCGAPIRLASSPASRLPKGVTPMNAIV